MYSTVLQCLWSLSDGYDHSVALDFSCTWPCTVDCGTKISILYFIYCSSHPFLQSSLSPSIPPPPIYLCLLTLLYFPKHFLILQDTFLFVHFTIAECSNSPPSLPPYLSLSFLHSSLSIPPSVSSCKPPLVLYSSSLSKLPSLVLFSLFMKPTLLWPCPSRLKPYCCPSFTFYLSFSRKLPCHLSPPHSLCASHSICASGNTVVAFTVVLTTPQVLQRLCFVAIVPAPLVVFPSPRQTNL